jgi:hypothetical protein
VAGKNICSILRRSSDETLSAPGLEIYVAPAVERVIEGEWIAGYDEPVASKADNLCASANGRPSVAKSWRARVHPPRITDIDERIANVERAAKRIKTDVQVDFVRARRGRRQ